MSIGQDALLRWMAPDGPWTEPDLHLFPQDGHRYEIVDGSLHVTPPLTATHETIVAALVATLRAGAPTGWCACSRLGVRVGTSHLVPDVTVLREGSSGAVWNAPLDVALVVEVETPESRRVDRYLKPTLYAEAGIESYWRIEVTAGRPIAQLYSRPSAGTYRVQHTVQPDESFAARLPYPVRLLPGGWTR